MRLSVTRIARIRLTAVDVDGLARFYAAALGFEHRESGGREPGRALMLQLGAESVELEASAQAGSPYPRGRSSCDPWFQHFAVVVSDMSAAYARLRGCAGWTPITATVPQRLPASSGGVTAFKFRDPEGHPLELLEFPASAVPVVWRAARGPGPCLGIDHSAIVVADTGRSAAFYADLGLCVAGRSLNRGPEQERLDGLPGAVVEVTALAAEGSHPPHLELLRYRSPAPPPPMARESSVSPGLAISAALPEAPPGQPAAGDVAATWLILEVQDFPATLARLRAADVPCVESAPAPLRTRPSAALRDPDGHLLRLFAAP